MRPVVKDSADLRSFLAQSLLPGGPFALSAIRLAVVLVAAAAAVLLIDGGEPEHNPFRLLAVVTGLVVVYALADNVAPKRSSQRSLDTLPVRPVPEPDSDDAAEQPVLACPAGRPGCWVLDSMQGLLNTARETTLGLEVTQTASTLARSACELVDADAAWVYRAEENGERIGLISSYLHPRSGHREEALSTKASQVAAECARSLGKGWLRENRELHVSRVDDCMVVPLTRRNRILGMLVVHCTGTRDVPYRLKEELVLSLANGATLALENSLLYQAQLDVEAKLRQFGVHRADYAATLSHELRTPLTSIKGFAQLLTRDQEASIETVRQYASTIAAEADKLALIVNDIVDLTRMETGLLQMHRKPVSLGGLLAGVAGRVEPMASPRRLRTSLPDRLPLIRVDSERLEQVLERLLVDAVGQSEPGSTMLLAAESGEEGVTVRLEYRTSEAHVANLNRALMGPGQLVEDGQATQLGRGRLGLYICRNFIEAHGGKMWIEQPEEQVARVVFTLPY